MGVLWPEYCLWGVSYFDYPTLLIYLHYDAMVFISWQEGMNCNRNTSNPQILPILPSPHFRWAVNVCYKSYSLISAPTTTVSLPTSSWPHVFTHIIVCSCYHTIIFTHIVVKMDTYCQQHNFVKYHRYILWYNIDFKSNMLRKSTSIYSDIEAYIPTRHMNTSWESLHANLCSILQLVMM